MFPLTRSYKVVYGKTVEDFDATNSKISSLVVFTRLLVLDPSGADLMMFVVKGAGPNHPINDNEVIIVIARMVEAVKACNNDVEKAVKSLAESTDVFAKFAGQLVSNAWKSHAIEKRRIRPYR